MKAPLLGIDGGQTGTRALLVSRDGSLLGRGDGPPVRHFYGDDDTGVRAAITESVRSAYAGAGLEPGELAAVACGVTSVRPNGPEANTVERIVRAVVTPVTVSVVPDYVTNLLGASDGEPGVVVVAGGGTVAYGQTADGREAVAGGFGYLLDDEGSGYGIGRQALGAAIRAADGRGGPTSLNAAVLGALGITDLEVLKEIVYAPQLPRGRIAGLSSLVAREAINGDRVAKEILARAGDQLCLAALAVLRRLFIPEEAVPVFLTGGVFAAGDLVVEPFKTRLRAGWPTACIQTPKHPPVVGAVLLAARLAGCSLSLSDVDTD